MVRGHDDQRLVRIGHFQCCGEGLVQFIGFRQGPGGTDAMMAMVNSAAFDHQYKTVLILGQARDSRLCQIDQRRFASWVFIPIEREFHVRAFKQAEYFCIRGEVDGLETSLVGDIDMVGGLCGPFGGQVATIRAASGAIGVLGI